MTVTYPFAVNDDYMVFSSATGAPITSYQYTITLKTVPANSHLYWLSTGYFNDSANDPWYTGVQTGGQQADGTNSTAANGGMINFSGWNATSATAGAGSLTRPFTWEGTGEEITRAQDIAAGMTFTVDVGIVNGLLTETVTDGSGHSFLVGSITAPGGSTSLTGALTLASEYFDAPASAYSDVSMSNFEVNGQTAFSIAPTVEHFGEAADGTTTHFVEAYSTSYLDTVNGVNPGGDVYTLDATGVTIDSDGFATDTLRLAKGFADLSGDRISNVPTLDVNGQNATMLLSQYQSFPTIENSAGGGSITLLSGGSFTTSSAVDTYMLGEGTGKVTVAHPADGGPLTLTSSGNQDIDHLTYLTVDVAGANLAAGSKVVGEGAAITVEFSGSASQYTLTANADHSMTVTDTVSGRDGSITLSNVQELQFSDHDLFMVPAPTDGGTGSGNITELYAAVLGRIPDVGGLAYYQQMGQTTDLPLLQFAEFFLSSPEYTGAAAHNYAQNSAGDGQFIADTYANLLHRAPEAGAASWYETNVINPILTASRASPGTAAYTSAELQAHAQVLVNFANSSEFLGDVQITPQSAADGQHWLLVV